MNYENTNCPSCGSEFAAGDDIVVCPICGTPHHRECWMNTGKCVNDGKHESGFVWTQPERAADEQKSENDTEAQPIELVCPSCGAECPPNSLVCPECGERFGIGAAFLGAQQGISVDDNYFFNGVNANPNDDIDGVKAKDAAAYIQMRCVRYIPKFIKMSEAGKKTSWNWAALFLSPLWFFYRKLYKMGAMFLGLTLIAFTFGSMPMMEAQQSVEAFVTANFEIENSTTLGEITEMYNALPEKDKQTFLQIAKDYSKCSLILAVSCLLPNIFAAIYADYLYKLKMTKEVKSMRKYSKDDKTFMTLALRRGGVSFLAAAGCYLVYTLFTDYVLNYL